MKAPKEFSIGIPTGIAGEIYKEPSKKFPEELQMENPEQLLL